jgi:hypothetical protein
MCDYSLEHVASRPAAVADRLTVVTFANTISRGFAGVDDVNCAVCLKPGTEIAFDQPVVYEHPVTWMQVTVPSRLARFRQIDTHLPRAHHDALEFENGEIVLLTRLLTGQKATVLQLPSVPLGVPEKAEEARAEARPATLTA